jgi:hypothetical protein
MELSELQGKIVKVVVPVKGKSFSMNLKVCRVKARSVLFIEVIKPERKNIFRKASMKMLDSFNQSTITFKDSTLLDKWESSWDAIGQFSPSVVKNNYPRRHFSKHSSGWAPKLPSTTNSSAGFPMV